MPLSQQHHLRFVRGDFSIDGFISYNIVELNFTLFKIAVMISNQFFFPSEESRKSVCLVSI